MAIYKLFPTQDTTLYSIYPDKNTGLDEILEASLTVGAIGTPAPQASRFLIKFDSIESIEKFFIWGKYLGYLVSEHYDDEWEVSNYD